MVLCHPQQALAEGSVATGVAPSEWVLRILLPASRIVLRPLRGVVRQTSGRFGAVEFTQDAAPVRLIGGFAATHG